MYSDLSDNAAADPWEVLGVSADADEATIRKAYLEKLRQFPPDRAPEQFQRIRDAYEVARDPVLRSRHFLVCDNPRAPLVSLLDTLKGKRNFAGPKPWLAVLKDK